MTELRQNLNKNELTDKIELLLRNLNAIPQHDENQKQKKEDLKTLIKHYAIQYKEQTGDWYRREWR